MNITDVCVYTFTSDGVVRSGTFLIIHSQLERLKTEGVVDVFQAIKSARIHRPGTIPHTVCLSSTLLCLQTLCYISLHERITISFVMKYWLGMLRKWTYMPTLRLLSRSDSVTNTCIYA